MSTNIQPFCFEGNEVRTVIKNDEPWFVAKDICDVLEHTNPTMALEMLDEDERAKESLGRQGETNIISESGLYTLVIRSNKPQAKPFRRWVTHEVLPSIRKTGAYNIPNKKEVTVNHKHMRGNMTENGLDIRYNLDLTKIITNPNAQAIELLERITGIPMSDVVLVQGDENNLESEVQLFIESCCEVGEEYRESTFSLFSRYRDWCKARGGSECSVSIRKFTSVIYAAFPKHKASIMYARGIRLKRS